MKSTQSPLQRINRVMKYYLDRGTNSERVNKVYRNIIREKLKQKKILIELMNSEDETIKKV